MAPEYEEPGLLRDRLMGQGRMDMEKISHRHLERHLSQSLFLEDRPARDKTGLPVIRTLLISAGCPPEKPESLQRPPKIAHLPLLIILQKLTLLAAMLHTVWFVAGFS